MDVERAEDFARRFRELWRAPAPARLDTVLADPVRLVAPLTPTTETLDDGRRTFASLLGALPDLTGEVHRWAATGDGVMIEFTLAGTAGGAPLSWDSVDRFVLREDGLASERVSYFDPLPILGAVTRRPRAWPAFLRMRTGR